MEIKTQVKSKYRRDAKGVYRWVEVEVPKYVFSEEDKIKIVSDYVRERTPASVIVEKYHLSSKTVLFSWVDKYLHEQESLSLPSETSEAMSKRSPEERIRELELENQRLSKALEMERLRSKAYDTMINVAEETFNIPIRKKSGTKR